MNGEQGYLENPLGVAPIGKTLAKFAIPAIISNLISSVQPHFLYFLILLFSAMP